MACSRRSLFLGFNPNYSEVTYELSLLDSSTGLRHGPAVSLLRALGVLREKGRKLLVVPEYVAMVRGLLADRCGLSQEQLDQALLAERKLGSKAEMAIVEYERKRLRSLGYDAGAELVRRISELDAGAGYDVESFDGDSPLFDYDRFIEVKASQEDRLRFFWSANERRVAEKRGERYWIYFVGGFRENKPEEIQPLMIQNPARVIQQSPELEIEVATYIVTQRERGPTHLTKDPPAEGTST